MNSIYSLFKPLETYPLELLVPEYPFEDGPYCSFGNPNTHIVYDHFKWVIEIKAGDKIIIRNITLIQIIYDTNGDTFLHDRDRFTTYPDVDMTADDEPDFDKPITWSSSITNVNNDTITISTLDAIGEYAQLYPESKPHEFMAIRNTLEAISTLIHLKMTK